MLTDGVSVIVPTRDSCHSLPTLLRSLTNQEEPPDETLIVDGASSDGTPAVATATGARVIVDGTPGGGRGSARNLGAAQARCSTLLFLDSDMEVAKGVISEVRALVKAGARAIILPETTSGRGLNGSIRTWERALIQTRNELCFARVLDRDLFLSTGGFDPRLWGFEDLDIQATLIERGITFQRTKANLIHHEEEFDVLTYFRKRRHYQRTSSIFRSKHPQLAEVVFSPYHRLKLYLSGVHGPRDLVLLGAASSLRIGEVL